MSTKIRSLLGSLGFAAGMSACTVAEAYPPAPVATAAVARPAPGQWVLNPALCPDLVEDRLDRRENRRDERRTVSQRDRREDSRDRREDRRDRRVTRCPARAWVWTGPAYRARLHPPRPARAVVYFDPGARHYYRRVGERRIVIRF